MDRDDYYDAESDEPNTLALDPALHNALAMQHEHDRRAAAAWADYCQDMAERQAADDADLLALQAGDEAREAGCPRLLRAEGEW